MMCNSGFLLTRKFRELVRNSNDYPPRDSTHNNIDTSQSLLGVDNSASTNKVSVVAVCEPNVKNSFPIFKRSKSAQNIKSYTILSQNNNNDMSPNLLSETVDCSPQIFEHDLINCNMIERKNGKVEIIDTLLDFDNELSCKKNVYNQEAAHGKTKLRFKRKQTCLSNHQKTTVTDQSSIQSFCSPSRFRNILHRDVIRVKTQELDWSRLRQSPPKTKENPIPLDHFTNRKHKCSHINNSESSSDKPLQSQVDNLSKLAAKTRESYNSEQNKAENSRNKYRYYLQKHNDNEAKYDGNSLRQKYISKSADPPELERGLISRQNPNCVNQTRQNSPILNSANRRPCISSDMGGLDSRKGVVSPNMLAYSSNNLYHDDKTSNKRLNIPYWCEDFLASRSFNSLVTFRELKRGKSDSSNHVIEQGNIDQSHPSELNYSDLLSKGL